MHEESMLVERCGLSETGTSKSLALGLSWAAKSSHPACPGATSAAKIDPKSNQNRSKIDPNSNLGDRGVPGSIQERLKKQPGRTQNGQGRVRDAPRALSGRPGVFQDSPRPQEHSRSATKTLPNFAWSDPRRSLSAFALLNAFRDPRRAILNRFGFDAQQLRSAFRIAPASVLSMSDVLRAERLPHAKTSKKQPFWASKSRPGASWGASGEQVGAPKRLSRAAKREKVARSSPIFWKASANGPTERARAAFLAAKSAPGSEASGGWCDRNVKDCHHL